MPPALNSPAAASFKVDPQTGLLSDTRQCPSPNQDNRPKGVAPELIIVHGISLPPGEFGGPHIESLFSNCLDWDAHPYFKEIEGVQVSAHLLIQRNGELVQFVPFNKRAWHAGVSSFRGRESCNDYSIGIELEGSDDTSYADQQYAHLALAIRAIMIAYPQISSRAIAGHCDVAPGRKTDPGPVFDWLRLYDGIGPLSAHPSAPHGKT